VVYVSGEHLSALSRHRQSRRSADPLTRRRHQNAFIFQPVTSHTLPPIARAKTQYFLGNATFASL
jgi:hypothetical protein